MGIDVEDSKGWFGLTYIFNNKRAAQQINARELLPFRFYNGYMPAKKRVIVATIAHPQSRDFKRWAAGDNFW